MVGGHSVIIAGYGVYGYPPSQPGSAAGGIVCLICSCSFPIIFCVICCCIMQGSRSGVDEGYGHEEEVVTTTTTTTTVVEEGGPDNQYPPQYPPDQY